ncbi:MAG: protein phosphatase 2C domain-containing protein, partial [Planctomycetota bacterium]
MSHIAASDVGMRRSNNQDSYLVSLAPDLDEWSERGHLFIVADGMGAHAAGELASKLAVENVAHIYRKHPELSPP